MLNIFYRIHSDPQTRFIVLTWLIQFFTNLYSTEYFKQADKVTSILNIATLVDSLGNEADVKVRLFGSVRRWVKKIALLVIKSNLIFLIFILTFYFRVMK
jgi:hypothetical protein